MDQRRFGEEIPIVERGNEREREDIDIMEWMRKNESGREQEVETAFGRRKGIL